MTEIQIEAIMEAIASQAAAAARIVGNDDIIEAAEKGNLDLVKDHVLADAAWFLELDSKGMTALMKSSTEGHLEITRFLVESGANVEATDYEGWTALMWSSLGTSRNLETTRFLVESKADVAAKNKNGETALKIAIENDNSDVAAYLRSVGAPE